MRGKARASLASLENSEVAVATATIVSPPAPHVFTENDILSFHHTNETINEVVAENKRSFDFTESLKMISTKIRETDSEEEYCESLEFFDKDENASVSVSFPSDAKHVIDFSQSGYLQSPDEVAIDFHMSDRSTYRFSCNNITPDRGTLVKDNMNSQSNNLRRSRFGTLFKINYMVRNRKYSVFASEKYMDSLKSKLPPAQRLRRHRHMLSYIERQLNTKQLERQGLHKMQRIYIETPKFREEIAVEEKLKARDIDISDFNRRIKNQHILINELSENLTISKASTKSINSRFL
ncbi:hypothetical protein GJ496_009138 [Pomphorhynchus laevis]|nr:hypothetical protein GJ496_009138 [Pomphorhynchus laevis]